MIMWSSSSIPTTLRASRVAFVSLMSSWPGFGSPDGWLCSMIIRVELYRMHFFAIMTGSMTTLASPPVNSCSIFNTCWDLSRKSTQNSSWSRPSNLLSIIRTASLLHIICDLSRIRLFFRYSAMMSRNIRILSTLDLLTLKVRGLTFSSSSSHAEISEIDLIPSFLSTSFSI